MVWMIVGSLLLVGVFYPNLLNNLLRVIPLGCAGIITLFGKEVYKKEADGKPVLVFPGILKLDVYATETPFTMDISVLVQTKGGQSLDYTLRVNYKIDFELLETYHNAIKMSEAELQKMIGGSIMSLLGNMASDQNFEKFLKQREAVGLALNCLSRLSAMPHLQPSLIRSRRLGLKEKVLDFYHQNREKIAELLRHEEENKKDRSEIETKSGTDIFRVDIIGAHPSDDTQKALNKEEADKARRRSARYKRELIQEFKKDGLTPEQASLSAEKQLGQLSSSHAINAPGFNGLLNLSLGGGSDKKRSGKNREEE